MIIDESYAFGRRLTRVRLDLRCSLEQRNLGSSSAGQAGQNLTARLIKPRDLLRGDGIRVLASVQAFQQSRRLERLASEVE